MARGLSFFAAFISVSVVVVGAFAACDDEKPASAFPDTFPDSGPLEGGPGFNADARADEDSGPQTCEPGLSADYHSPTFTPPAKTSSCSAADIGGYYDTCYADPPSTGCSDWLAAHKACGDCIEAPSGPIAAAKDRQSLLLSRSGCIAIVVKAADAGVDTCSAPFDAAFQCRRASCGGCFGAGQTSEHALQIFNTCGTKANESGCKQYVDAQGPGCSPLDTVTATCFPTAAEQSALTGTDEAKAAAADRTYLTRVFSISCGT